MIDWLNDWLIVHRSFRALPFTNLFLTLGGWLEVKWVYCKVWVSLKCVLTSRMDRIWNCLPLYTTAWRNVILVFEISAVNLIAGWCEFVCKLFARRCCSEKNVCRGAKKTAWKFFLPPLSSRKIIVCPWLDSKPAYWLITV